MIQRFFIHVAKTNNTIFFTIILFIFVVCKDILFIDSKVSQHFTFQNEVFSTFKKFTYSHKIYFRDNITFDVCEKKVYCFQIAKWDFPVHWRCIICPKDGKNL